MKAKFAYLQTRGTSKRHAMEEMVIIKKSELEEKVKDFLEDHKCNSRSCIRLIDVNRI